MLGGIAAARRRGHPLVSLQMEYSLFFARRRKPQGQIAPRAKRSALAHDGAMPCWRPAASSAPRRRGGISATGDVRARHPPLRDERISRRTSSSARRLRQWRGAQGATLAQLAIAWTMAMSRRTGALIVPIPEREIARPYRREYRRGGPHSSRRRPCRDRPHRAAGAAHRAHAYQEGAMHRLNGMANEAAVRMKPKKKRA